VIKEKIKNKNGGKFAELQPSHHHCLSTQCEEETCQQFGEWSQAGHTHPVGHNHPVSHAPSPSPLRSTTALMQPPMKLNSTPLV
uniref:Uncharacterized protein n=1 Tax=Pseudonaja textilis TaxID=8673 RepID=A0A670ZCB5_PSETE